MSMNVFIDTNVLIDVLAKREPFYADSACARIRQRTT
jgi:predicted nucleic acid-binding protein